MGVFGGDAIVTGAMSASLPNERHNGAILITGGSGVVGRALIRCLEGYPVLALRHNQEVDSDVRTITGDLSVPHLGLDAARYSALANEVSLIVHCAAITSVAPRTDHRAVNINGTKEILHLAERGSIPIVYVSTAFVTEDISQVDEPSGYEASKREAEELIRSADVPTVIVRPSLVAGDSKTGEISQFQGLHLILSHLAQNLLPVAPCHPKARVDFIPQDYLARVIKALIDSAPSRWPDLVWATQGDAAITAEGFLDVMQSLSTDVGLPKPTSRFIPYERVKRLFEPVFLPALPRGQRREIRALMMFARYLNVERPFPSLTPELAKSFDIPAVPSPTAVLASNFQHWWQNYGVAAVQNADNGMAHESTL